MYLRDTLRLPAKGLSPSALPFFISLLKVEAIYVGPAHTSNDVVLWVPERRLAFSGDVIFNGDTPFVIAGSVGGLADGAGAAAGLGRADDRAGARLCVRSGDYRRDGRLPPVRAGAGAKELRVRTRAPRGCPKGGPGEACRLARRRAVGRQHAPGLLGDQGTSLWAQPWTPGR